MANPQNSSELRELLRNARLLLRPEVQEEATPTYTASDSRDLAGAINMPLPGGGTEEMMYDMALSIHHGDTKAKFIATLLGEYTEKHEVEAKGAVIFLPKRLKVQELAKR